MLLLEAVDQPLLKTQRVLEFASGHGRFTRHLTKALGAGRVVVSDVVPSAVEFSKNTFGVDGFLSASAPEQVQWPQRYALVFVLSLFSHLPRSTWSRWLKVLYEAVAPGGLLGRRRIVLIDSWISGPHTINASSGAFSCAAGLGAMVSPGAMV